jgi:hypothetical protein
LYQIKTTSDDGVRVNVNGQRVIDAWYDQGNTPPHSGFFYWAGGNAPITIEYYDNTGGAGIAFELKAATSFTDTNLDVSTRWLTNVFTWNPNQGTPVSNFYENSDNRIGVIDQGSNIRGDGKKGISFNLGKGALINDPNRLPDDLFVVRSYTWADFDGSSYKFHVSGDDGYQILAKNQSTQQWYYITPQNQWQYGTQDIQFSLPAGRYDLHYHYFENGGDANFDLAWERASNPDITIKLDFFGNFTQTQKDLINKAAQNWSNVITKDMVPEGVLNIAVSEGSTRTDGSAWNGIWAVTDFPGVYPVGTIATPGVRYNLSNIYDGSIGTDYHTRMHFNSAQLANSSWVNTYLVRLATHELGHALYLDEAQYDSLLSLNGIMDLQGLDASMTEGIYQRLEYLGYSVNGFVA